VTTQTPVATVTTVGEENTKQQLLGFPSHYYVVQLLAAKNDSTITRYRNSHPDIHAESVSVDYSGNHFQLLILAVYASYSEARQAVERLPVSLEPTPWIRPLAPLQTFL
jgi:septal ring-binding cell division protein DamX